LLLKIARTFEPFIGADTLVSVSVVDVALGISAKVAPPSLLSCHFTVGVGVPLAVALKTAFEPALTTVLTGLPVMLGAESAASATLGNATALQRAANTPNTNARIVGANFAMNVSVTACAPNFISVP
jgi:hypothetical protein